MVPTLLVLQEVTWSLINGGSTYVKYEAGETTMTIDVPWKPPSCEVNKRSHLQS